MSIKVGFPLLKKGIVIKQHELEGEKKKEKKIEKEISNETSNRKVMLNDPPSASTEGRRHGKSLLYSRLVHRQECRTDFLCPPLLLHETRLRGEDCGGGQHKHPALDYPHAWKTVALSIPRPMRCTSAAEHHFDIQLELHLHVVVVLMEMQNSKYDIILYRVRLTTEPRPNWVTY